MPLTQWKRLAGIIVVLLASASMLAQGSLTDSIAPRLKYVWVEPTPLDHSTAERLFTLYDTGRYGEFDSLRATIESSSFLNPFEFEVEAESWIAAASDRPRRSLVVATVALELAIRQRGVFPSEPRLGSSDRTVHQMNLALAELGCAFLREHPPSPVEHSWHTAFIAFARLSSIVAPVRPPPKDRREVRADDMTRATQARVRREYEALLDRVRRQASSAARSTRLRTSGPFFDHQPHLLKRFSDSPLPEFADAIARENISASLLFETLLSSESSPVWLSPLEVEEIARRGAKQVRALPTNRRMDRTSAERLLRIAPDSNPPDQMTLLGQPMGAALRSRVLWEMVDAFRTVTRDDVGAEAYIHLGQNYVRLAQPEQALQAFARAEALAGTPYELHLARVFAGAVFERAGRNGDAVSAFRSALVAVPRARSASLALVTLLLAVDAREEAAAILEEAMALPQPEDPLDYYLLGDPAAVPRAFARIRQELQR